MAKLSWAIEDEDFWQAVEKMSVAKGKSHADARDYVIVERLINGDAAAFLAAHTRGETVGPLVQEAFACMLRGNEHMDYHLKIVRRPGLKGAPLKAGLRWRDFIVTQAYEQQRKRVSYDEAMEATAGLLRMSASAVKGAVTRWRKLARKATESRTTIKS